MTLPKEPEQQAATLRLTSPTSSCSTTYSRFVPPIQSKSLCWLFLDHEPMTSNISPPTFWNGSRPARLGATPMQISPQYVQSTLAPHMALHLPVRNFGVLVRPTAQRICAHSHSSVLLQTPARTVALLGPTNLDWIVSAFGLSKCGFTVLALSPRLSYQAMVKLMQETDCHCLVYYASPQLRPVVDQVQLAMDVALLSMMPRSDYDVPTDKLRPFVREFDILEEKKRYAAIVHSSGSTGLPKPIYYQHTKFTQPYQVGVGDRHLFTLPLSVKPALPSIQNLCETSLTSVGTLDTTHSPSQSLSPTCISARRSSS